MEHNAAVKAPRPAIHPAAAHCSSSVRLHHTDGPLLCHEISFARVLLHAVYWSVCVCVRHTTVAGDSDKNV